MKKKTVFFIFVAAVLIASAIFISCQQNSEITTPSDVQTLILNAPPPPIADEDITWDEPVCVGEPVTFTLTWTGGDGDAQVQIQIEVSPGVWEQLPNNPNGQSSSPTNISHTFDVVGTENLRYKIQTGVYTVFQVEVVECGECETWQEETAFGGNSAGPEGSGPGCNSGWWFYYDVSIGGTQTISAGQDIDVGTVVYDGTQIIINLTGGWELQDVSEPVKIQGYGSGELPACRQPAGQFTTYKGDDLTVTVTAFSYYIIHLDVRLCTQ